MYLPDFYFMYSSLLELIVILFVRTRSSIKHFPKLITAANVTFIVYLNMYMYAAQMQAFFLLVFVTLALTCLFLLMFEIPAI